MRVLPRHFLILSLSTVHKFGCFAIALQIIELTTCTKKLEDKSAITMSCLLMSNLQQITTIFRPLWQISLSSTIIYMKLLLVIYFFTKQDRTYEFYRNREFKVPRIKRFQRIKSYLFFLAVYRRVTRGGEEVSPGLFQKLGKSALIWRKTFPDCSHLWVKFLI